MEYVNVRSIRTPQGVLRKEQKELLEKFDSMTPEDHIIATDDLELLRGEDLIDAVFKTNKVLVPLRRASYIDKTKYFPKRVLLELTSRCNSYCTMCPRNALTRPEMDMDVSLAKRVIGELGTVGINGLWLYWIGESLLYPHFFEILSFCRSVGNLGPLWLSTNGEIMGREIQEKILDNPVDILNYSLNAMTKDSFSKITPKLHFDRVHQNLRSLLELKKKRNAVKPVIRVQMIEIPYVLDEIELFKKEYGALADILSINKLEIFSQNVKSNTPEAKSKNMRINCCNRLEREDFFILSNGLVTVCDTDFNCVFNIGDIQTQTIREIYDGPRYRDLLKKYRDGRLHEESVCSQCYDYHL